jgi:hypothetical protein
MGDVDYRVAAQGKHAALEAGWEVDEVIEYLEALPGFLQGIAEGVFDGPEIKSIVAACFARKEQVMAGAQPMRRAAYASAVGPLLGENGLVIRPVNTDVRAIAYDGRRYSKDDLKGKAFRSRPGLGPWYLQDLLMKIVDVGRTYLTCELMEDPQLKYPTSDVLKKKAIGKGTRINWLPSNADFIFEK